MKGKSSPNIQEVPKQIIKKHLTLSQIFKDQQLLGWQILDIESGLYSEMDVSIESITLLTSLYMKAIQKLNSLQDPRQQYFNLKMQRLMAQPYVIRCFNHNQDHKKNALQSKRKQLQQKIEREVERQNHRKVVQQVIIAQQQKQKKMMDKVKQMMELSNKNLQNRRKRRSEIKQMRSSILNSSLMGSQQSVGNQSPRFSSHKISRDRFKNHIGSNSSFEFNIAEEQEFYIMKRQIQQQQYQQKIKRKLQRQKQEDVLLQ